MPARTNASGAASEESGGGGASTASTSSSIAPSAIAPIAPANDAIARAEEARLRNQVSDLQARLDALDTARSETMRTAGANEERASTAERRYNDAQREARAANERADAAQAELARLRADTPAATPATTPEEPDSMTSDRWTRTQFERSLRHASKKMQRVARGNGAATDLAHDVAEAAIIALDTAELLDGSDLDAHIRATRAFVDAIIDAFREVADANKAADKAAAAAAAAAATPSRAPKGPASTTSRSAGECFNCGLSGHWARDCGRAPRRQARGGGGRQGRERRSKRRSDSSDESDDSDSDVSIMTSASKKRTSRTTRK